MVERQNPSVKNPVFRRILFGILTIAVLLALLTIGVWAEVSGGTVSDGVYALKNKATGKFLDIQYDSPNAGMHIQQYAYDITPSTPDTRSGLFKFTHRGGNNYLIRSMRNNANSFYRQSDTAVLTTPIETVDIDNPMKAHWILSDAGDGYVYLRAYGTSKYLCMPSSGVNNDKYCTTETLASGGDRAKWKMVRYTGSAMYGVVLSSWTDTMTVDETTRISAYMYTTDMAYHGPVRYSVAAWDSSSADNLATVDADGNVTVNGAGRFRIRMTYAGAPTSWYWDVTARLADGVYFLQNRQMERYMQVDDDDAPNYTNNGGIMEIHPLDGEDYQRWSFTYIGDGYYKITSVVNGYALTVPAGSTTGDNVDLILKPYAGTDNQKWRITMTRNGSSKIKAKSSESYTSKDLVMSLETALYTNGTNIRQREYLDNSSYKDEWYCVRMLPTNGSELEYDPAAWAGIPSANNNCYGYALNNQLHEPSGNSIWRKQQPGEYYNAHSTDRIPEGYQSPASNIVNSVLKDFAKYNSVNGTSLTFTPIGRYETCPPGTYKVALVAAPSISDYHWYRQDADGLWSHKRGTTAVKRTDESGKLIIDPMTADRANYSIFVGYFAVKPWNNMYVLPTTLAAISDDITSNVMASTEVNDMLLSQVQIGMTYNEVIEMLNNRGTDIGSGTIVQQYYSESGVLYTFVYASTEAGFVVSNIKIGDIS